jgi:rhomboid protease GluP
MIRSSRDEAPSSPPASPGYVLVKAPSTKPTATYTLMGITILIFLGQMIGEYLLGGDFLANGGMKVNDLIVKGQLWRLITPVFLHGSIMHVAFNMYALFVLGPGLERHYGHSRFLALYLLSGFAGNVISFWFSSANSLGSSTAIFGLLGAEGIFLYRNKSLFGSTAQRALVNVVVIAVINLMLGLSPGIDNWGHIGGIIAGTAFAWLAGPIYRVEGIGLKPELIDERGSGDALRAGIGVGGIFALLSALKIFLKL